MKIVSRLDETAHNLKVLQDIIEVATGGAIGPDGDLALETTLHGLVGQVDITCASLLDHTSYLDRQLEVVAHENLRMSVKIAEQDEVLSTLHKGVPYDEDLDHATADLMDAFLGSGAATPTFDGEISFDEAVVFSKSDLKPMLREAIQTWLRLKTT